MESKSKLCKSFVATCTLCLLPVLTHARFNHAFEQRHVEKRHTRHHGGWTFPKSPVLNHYQFGVQHLIIPGVFDVDGEQRPVLLLVYLKACLAANNSMVVGFHKKEPIARIVWSPSPHAHTDMAWAGDCIRPITGVTTHGHMGAPCNSPRHTRGSTPNFCVAAGHHGCAARPQR